jgi:hypothetical protein
MAVMEGKKEFGECWDKNKCWNAGMLELRTMLECWN